MIDSPKRIRLSRTKGWRMPADTIKVDRTGPYGNPVREKELTWVAVSLGFRGDRVGRLACAVELFRRWRGLEPKAGPLAPSGVEVFATNVHVMLHGESIIVPEPPALDALRGKNVACWCGLCPAHAEGKPLGVECADCAPCHGDVTLELANAPLATPPHPSAAAPLPPSPTRGEGE